MPGQTLADVCAAEGAFVREVALRHPDAPKPVIIGNCQGGWAAMLVAASNPHVTGPIVAQWRADQLLGRRARQESAALSWAAWRWRACRRCCCPISATACSTAPALVLNFEKMNPGNTWWSKYYTVFANADTEGPRFKGFEKWWSSFYMMNEAEIRWIVENLFIGNKLQRGVAVLGGAARSICARSRRRSSSSPARATTSRRRRRR